MSLFVKGKSTKYYLALACGLGALVALVAFAIAVLYSYYFWSP